ncbi:MAG: hypothetical protein CEE38_04190 [Planctomycetes bacterium B3_Pla]|nr:MAG: hypothetical protein CEE38_04190 [Planctomycetes bacterium B3_Pla]
MKKLIIYIICSAVLALSGCAFTSPEQTHGYATQGIDAIDRNTQANLNIAQANPDLDPVKVAEAGKSFEDQRESYREAFEQIRKQIEEERLQREAIVSALASIAIEAIPAGSSALQVAKAVGFKIDTAADKAIEAANAKTEEVKTTANDNKKEIVTLTGATEGIARDIGGFKEELDKMEEDIGVLKKDKITTDIDFALAKKTLESLDPAMQEKLSNVPENVIVELTKLKADEAAFRERLQRELQFTNEEMKALEGMSTEKIMALVLAATGAVGAGGLTGRAVARHGPSRGAKKLEELEKAIADKQDK